MRASEHGRDLQRLVLFPSWESAYPEPRPTRSSLVSFQKFTRITAALSLTFSIAASAAAAEPVKVKVFIGSMFEIGQNTGDRAGEFQHWYERYFSHSQPVTVKGP